ncbi:MAG: lamin tail domain-containing protein [Flavobacteriales bacterium]
MKSFLITVLLLFSFFGGFSQFTDNFGDGNFSTAPTWSGDASDFIVTANELQLNAPSVSSNKYLSTNSQAINNATWEFKVRMGFAPSSSNYSRVYLVSNSANLGGSLNGYFVKIGGSDDEVSLFNQTGTSETKIIDGRDGTVAASGIDVNVRVTRSNSGSWEVFTDTSAATSFFISEGTVTDNSHNQSLFFGVRCNFTSTRSSLFFFDNFVTTGTAFVDTVKPILDTIIALNNTQIELTFDEPVQAITAQNIANYSANNGIGTPSVAVPNSLDLSKVTVTFVGPFPAGIIHQLTVSNVMDLAGNTMDPQTKPFLFFTPAIPVYRDVVINEIFADPSPIIGLPDGEFIEIYNTSTTKIFDLANWQFTDGSSTSSLPSYTLLPDSYVILYANSTSGDFSVYSNKLGLSSFPSLNNSGETIELLDNTGNTIDKVEYDNSMYQDATKDDGGWSLEQLNPFSPCYNPENWGAAINLNGGTPGSQNSINLVTNDIQNPAVVSTYAIANNQIEITFSEPIDTALFISSSTISGARTITSYSPLNTFGTQLLLTISPVLDTGIAYTISTDSLLDCSGNFSTTSSEVYLANLPVAGTIILNEILFNPISGEEDFVELYNNSDLYLNLKDWSLANDEEGLPDNIKTIETNYIIKPDDYVVITKNFSLIPARYKTHSPTKFIELETLPTFANDDGTVYILTPTLGISDKFYYEDNYHFALLRSTDGVSLERLDFNRETNEKSNWHSAATEVGYATPGVKNSQFNPAILTQETIEVSPKLFSPDSDGFEDILTLSYSLEESGFMGNVSIYDAKGRLIKKLVQNQLLAKEGAFTWDGTTNNSNKARMGAYIILFEFYDLEGNVRTVKKSCAVGHRL